MASICSDLPGVVCMMLRLYASTGKFSQPDLSLELFRPLQKHRVVHGRQAKLEQKFQQTVSKGFVSSLTLSVVAVVYQL